MLQAAAVVSQSGEATISPVATTETGGHVVRVVILGDTAVMDGMKSYHIDYIRALKPLGVHFTWLDTLCEHPDVDSLQPVAQGGLLRYEVSTTC